MKQNCILNVNNISSIIRRAIFVINIPTCAIAIVGNLIVLSVFLWHKELRTRPNLLICYLALTDLAAGIILQPLLSVHLLFDLAKDGCFMADAVYFLTSVVCGASCLTLVLISYDRYLHLVKLFKYKSLMPKRKLYILVVLCWVVPIIEGCFLFNHATVNVFFVLVVMNTITDFIIMCICYTKIYKFIKKMSKVRSSLGGAESNENSRLRTNSKIAKCFFSLVASFVILWTPLKIALIYITIASITGINFSAVSPYVDSFHFIAIMIGICNSSLNPVIYFWKNKVLKEKTKGVILKVICRLSSANNDSTQERTGKKASPKDSRVSVV